MEMGATGVCRAFSSGLKRKLISCYLQIFATFSTLSLSTSKHFPFLVRHSAETLQVYSSSHRKKQRRTVIELSVFNNEYFPSPCLAKVVTGRCVRPPDSTKSIICTRSRTHTVWYITIRYIYILSLIHI